MQKNLLSIALILVTTVAHANRPGSASDNTTDFKKFQIGASISPNVCYRFLWAPQHSQSSEYLINFRKTETVIPGFTAGLNFCYNIKKFIGIETGIQYALKGYQYAEPHAIPTYRADSLLTSFRFIYHFGYLEIPFKVNFTVGSKKVRFFSSVGIATGILVYQATALEKKYTDHTYYKNYTTHYSFEKVNVSPTISAGIDYKINPRMNLRVEPTFSFGAIRIINAPIHELLYSGGLNISYYFGL